MKILGPDLYMSCCILISNDIECVFALFNSLRIGRTFMCCQLCGKLMNLNEGLYLKREIGTKSGGEVYNQLLDVEMLKNINWSNWDIENMGDLSSESSLQTIISICKFTILNRMKCKLMIVNCK